MRIFSSYSRRKDAQPQSVLKFSGLGAFSKAPQKPPRKSLRLCIIFKAVFISSNFDYAVFDYIALKYQSTYIRFNGSLYESSDRSCGHTPLCRRD